MAGVKINLAICALFLVNVTVQVRAHAFSKVPAARQFLNPHEYTPSGANGRDPPGPGGTLMAVCGDFGNQPTLPVFGKRAQFGIPLENHFVAGQKATFRVNVLAAHKGRFEWRICQYSGDETVKTLNKACLDKHILQPVHGQSRVVPGMPWWWLGNLGGGDFEMEFIIPDDLNCDGVNTHCVMQMVYQNGNSCNPPGPSCPESDPSNCFHVGYNPVCTLAGWETFRNCIDIVVKGKGGGGPGPVRKPPVTARTPPKTPVTTKTPPAPRRRVPPVYGDACCARRADGYQPNPRNCRFVCKCKGGKTLKRLKCRVGFKFDKIRKKCRIASHVRC